MEECGLIQLEIDANQCVRQALSLEVDGRECQPRGNSQPNLYQSFPLPSLRRGMINLKDAQSLSTTRIPQREGVETRSQNDRLADAPRDRKRKAILRKAAACSDKGPHAALRGIAGGQLRYDRVRVGSKNPVR